MDLKNKVLQPSLISNPHPLLSDGREYHYGRFFDGETLGDYCARNNVAVPKSSVALFVNGERVLADWTQFVPKHGDSVTLKSAAEGGGGRKVFSIVAMIALVVAAPYIAGPAGMGFQAGTAAYSLATGAIMLGGSLLINAILPPIAPSALGFEEKEQSPTYGINAGQNRINQYGPMTVVFGKHKLVPYLASKSYTYFHGDDQYLAQAFHLGLQPGIDISQIKIGDTLIGNYRDVEIQRSMADGRVSLVSGNVDSIDGFEISSNDGWTVRTSPLNTEFIDVDLTATLYSIEDDGSESNVSVEIEAQYSVSGQNDWKPLGGTYETKATHYWSLGYETEEYLGASRDGPDRYRTVWNQVSYDENLSANAHRNGDTEVRLVTEYQTYETGTQFRKRRVAVNKTVTWRWKVIPRSWKGVAPNPSISRLGTGVELMTGRSAQKPTRATMSTEVPRGVYDVRVRKITGDISTNRRSNTVSVGQMRFTQADDADYSGQDRLAIQIKATSQLSGVIDELSVIASASCLINKGGVWVEEETSNPAWWYLHWALGRFDMNGHRIYGEGLDWSRIDVDGIIAWAAFCEAKDLTFNWVLDRKMSIEDVYYTIARAGRAGVTWQTGKRGVVFDSSSIPVTTSVTPANIVADSFEYTYINTEVADEIIVNFYNKDLNYEKDDVRQKVPGVIEVNNPITLDYEGCTDVEMAGREANLLAASQHYHRKQYKWEMDIEGILAVRGDVVRMTHDLTDWGASGRLMEANGKSLTLDSFVNGVTGGWLALRDNKNQIAYLRTNGAKETDELVITDNWPEGFNPPTADNSQDYIWQYSPKETPGRLLHIKSVKPKEDSIFAFEAIEYSSEYYASENGDFGHLDREDPNYFYTPVRVSHIMAYEKDVNEINENTTVIFTWILSEPATSSAIITANGRTHSVFNSLYGNAVEIIAKTGDKLEITVTPQKEGRAVEPLSYSYVVAGTNEFIPAPTGLEVIGEFTAREVRIKWDRVKPAVGYVVEVSSGGTIRRTVQVGDVLTYTYSSADMQQDGGASRHLTLRVRALGKGSSKSEWAEVTASNPQIDQLKGIEVLPGIESIVMSFDMPEVDDLAGYLYWISDDINFVPTANNPHFEGTYNQYFFERFNGEKLEYKDYYVWAAGFDTFGKDSLNISSSIRVKPILVTAVLEEITSDIIESALGEQMWSDIESIPNIKQDIVNLDLSFSEEIETISQDLTNKVGAVSAKIDATEKRLSSDIDIANEVIDTNRTELEGSISKVAEDLSTAATNLDERVTEEIGTVNEKINTAEANLSQSIDATNEELTNAREALEHSIGDTNSELGVVREEFAKSIDGVHTLIGDTHEDLSESIDEKTTDLQAIIRANEEDAEGRLADVLNNYDNLAKITATNKTVEDNHKSATEALNTHISVFEGNVAAVDNKIATLVNNNQSVVESVNSLTSQFDNAIGEVRSDIVAVSDDAQSAIVKSDTLKTQMVGDYSGTDPSQVSSGLLKNIVTSISDTESALMQSIQSIEVGVGEQFDYSRIWHFDNDAEGWTGSVYADGTIRQADGVDYLYSPDDLDINGSENTQLKLRIRKIGNPVWAGLFSVNTMEDQSWAHSTLEEPTFDSSGITTIDVRDLDVFGRNICQLMLCLSTAGSTDASNHFSIDWIALGRPSPGASTAQVRGVEAASVKRDNAIASDVDGLTARVGSAEASIDSQQAVIASNHQALTQALSTQKSEFEDSIAGVNIELTTLADGQSALVADTEQIKVNYDSVVASVEAETLARTSADEALAQQANNIASVFQSRLDQEGLDRASDVAALDSRITDTNAAINEESTTRANEIEALAQASNSMEASFTQSIEQLGNNLTGEVENREHAVSDINQQIVDTNAALASESAARADAVGALTERSDTIEANFAKGLGDANAAIEAEAVTRADEVSALLKRAETFETSFSSDLSETNAALEDEILIRSAADEALANQTSLLEASFRNSEEDAEGQLADVLNNYANKAAIEETNLVFSNEVKSLTESIASHVSTFYENKAEVSQQLTTLAEKDTALASDIEGLGVRVGKAESAITESNKTIADNHQAATEALESHVSVFEDNKSEVSNQLVTLAGVDAALSGAIDLLTAATDSNEATINEKTTALASDIEAATESLEGQISAVSDDVTAKIEDESRTRSTEQAALANQTSLLEASFRNSGDDAEGQLADVLNNYANKAAIARQDTVFSDGLKSLASTVEAHAAEFEGNIAGVKSDISTLADDSKVIAESVNNLGVEFGGALAEAKADITLVATDAQSAVTKTDTLKNQMVGGYDGTDPSQVSSGLLKNIVTSINEAESALMQSIESLEVGVGEQFDHSNIWHFDGDSEGWSGVYSSGGIRAEGTDYVTSPELNLSGAENTQIKMRVKQVGNPEWQGLVDVSGVISQLPAPTLDESGVATLDFKDVAETGSTITQIRVRLATNSTETDHYLIDWIAIGRPAPGASTSQVRRAQLASIERDTALASDISEMGSRIGDAESEIVQSNKTIADNHQAATEALSNYASEFEANKAEVDGRLITLAEVDQTLASQTSSLQASFRNLDDDAEGQLADVLNSYDNRAAITVTNEVVADNFKSITDSLEAHVSNFNSNSAQVTEKLTTLANQDTAIVNQLSELATATENSLSDVVQGIDLVSTDAQSAINKIDAFQTRLVGDYDGTEPSEISSGILKNIVTVISDTEQALSRSIETIGTEFGEARGEITSLQQTIANDKEAQSKINSQLSSSFGEATGQITALQKTIADDKKSQAELNTQLESSIGENLVAVSDISESVADINGRLEATRTLRVGVNKNGVNYLAGISMSIDNDGGTIQSQVVVLGSLFSVMDSVNGVPRSFFSVKNGKTYIENGFITSLTADNILTNSLTGNLFRAGSITADEIDSRGLTIKDNSGNIIFGSGKNLDISKISGLGDLASKDKASTSDITGLGTLATRNDVTSSHFSGSLPNSKVSGLGVFATAGRITSSNVSTYIANAAIREAQIGNAQVTNAKIGNAAITEAKIGSAAITSAKIGDLQVQRLKIANNAVTTMSSVYVTRTNHQNWSMSLPAGRYIFFYDFQSGLYNSDHYNLFINGVQLTRFWISGDWQNRTTNWEGTGRNFYVGNSSGNITVAVTKSGNRHHEPKATLDLTYITMHK